MDTNDPTLEMIGLSAAQVRRMTGQRELTPDRVRLLTAPMQRPQKPKPRQHVVHSDEYARELYDDYLRLGSYKKVALERKRSTKHVWEVIRSKNFVTRRNGKFRDGGAL